MTTTTTTAAGTGTSSVTPQQRLTIIKHLAAGNSADMVADITRLTREEVVDIAADHGYPRVDALKKAAGILERNLDRAQASTAISTATTSPSGVDLTDHRAPAPAAAATTAGPAASGTPTRPDEFRILINTAKSMPSKRIQSLANRILDDTAKLRSLIQAEQDKAAARQADARKRQEARAEVDRLEKQLREAKARLRGTPAPARKAGGRAAGKVAVASGQLTQARANAHSVLLSNVDLQPHGLTSRQLRTWALEHDIDVPLAGRLPRRILDAYLTHAGDAA